MVNNLEEIMACSLSSANIDDRKPVPKLKEWLFGDKGYLGKEFLEKLKAQSIDLFTKVKKNMKQGIVNAAQQFYLSTRGLIETVNDQLKNIYQIEHTCHRKPANAFVNIISALIAYCFKPRKPSFKNNKLPTFAPSLTSN